MRFDHLSVVPSLAESSTPMSRVISWDGDQFVAATTMDPFDAIDAELDALSEAYVPDLSPVKSPHCALRWTEDSPHGCLPWVCTQKIRHSGDHQALTPDDTCVATRPKRPRTSPPPTEPAPLSPATPTLVA